MKTASALAGDPVIAKSLKVSRTTFTMVSSFTALMAADSMLTLQVLNAVGEATVLALTFVFVAVAASAIVTDLFLRSSQTVATLRSLGAKKTAIIKSILVNLLMSGGIGSVVGIVIGLVVGVGLNVWGAQGVFNAGGAAVNAFLVLVLSGAAMGSGVYVGVMRSWRN